MTLRRESGKGRIEKLTRDGREARERDREEEDPVARVIEAFDDPRRAEVGDEDGSDQAVERGSIRNSGAWI